MLSDSVSKPSGMFGGNDTVIDFPMPLDLNSSSEEFKLSEVDQVFCGATGTAFVNKEGKCFVVGTNKNGELG